MSDTIESFSVESILKMGIVSAFGIVLVPVAIYLVAKTLPAILDGGLSTAGVALRSVTTRPVGYVRRAAADIRGL